MHSGRAARALLMAVAILVVSCAPTIREVGRTQGCYTAEEYLDAYIVRRTKRERFKRNLPYKVALLPLSVTVGFLFNYLGQAPFIEPLLELVPFSPTGGDFEAFYLENAVHYSPFRGSRLDDLDDAVIAFANFDIGMCYYELGNYAQASAFLESLVDSKYHKFIGKENLYFLLGDCYYMLSMYDTSINNYRLFLHHCRERDDRISLVERRIKTIDALNRKGLWGIEEQ